jgi:hypothetical protein
MAKKCISQVARTGAQPGVGEQVVEAGDLSQDGGLFRCQNESFTLNTVEIGIPNRSFNPGEQFWVWTLGTRFYQPYE